ncbi:FMN-binding glutamate synthase family protein [Geosporobacter ferrireducens]|uniref:Glutamate synthase n=1 Tax=Geosporobacter ferrireducens TaxID=1424294 RepID=A0A1D8GH32_9FIRM|nr:FMN-binding glutamate synthase family protein [Geosporobacter ferrireducens]AOT70217.1 glutamate synthase [Geosporobacter ferrireducens]MTI53233.1 FMN-binding glutamate synthase family protein [Geosporobacter ferrireducens]
MSQKSKQRALSPVFHPIRYLFRRMLKRMIATYTEILMTDDYEENVWEIFTASYKTGFTETLENELRAASGIAIDRPLGSARKFPSLNDLMFGIAQLHTMPIEFEDYVDTRVVIGKKSKKSFTIDIPILIAPMAYGTALSRDVKIAFAKAAAQVGTAATSGEGPILPEERDAAKYCILQYNRGDWAKDEEMLCSSDAIEIQFGQGAIGGIGSRTKAEKIDAEMLKYFRYPAGYDLVAHSRQPEVQHAKDLEKLVKKLKDITGGVPIGAKIGAGKYLEADLDILCSSGVDFICVDSCEAGTKGSVPILQDDFGIPAPFAISRSAEWLYKHHLKDQITLIASGKIRAPGDMLKACALGADACYIGNAALFTVSHTQALKTIPYEPVTQLVWHGAKYTDEFDLEAGAASLANYLKSCKEELDRGIRALGKKDLKDVNKGDLVSLSELISKGCGVPMAYEPYEYPDKLQKHVQVGAQRRKIRKMEKKEEPEREKE